MTNPTTEALMALIRAAMEAYASQSPEESAKAEAALASALAEVVKDAERLDFLDMLNTQKNNHFGTVYGWRLIEGTHRIALEDYHHNGSTVRDAIDAALAARSAEQNGV